MFMYNDIENITPLNMISRMGIIFFATVFGIVPFLLDKNRNSGPSYWIIFDFPPH